MELITLFENNGKFFGTFATNREDSATVIHNDILKAFERARIIQCTNPDVMFRNLLEDQLDMVDIVFQHDTIQVVLPRHKALYIMGDADADLILDDGGYAYIWLIDGLVKCDLHQGRIARAIEPDEKIEDVANELCDKQYYQEWVSDVVTDEMIDEIIAWLCVGMTKSDFEMKSIAIDEKEFNNEVNTFLNLK